MIQSARNEPGNPSGAFAEDPLSLFSAALTKSKTIWMALTYPFAGFGQGVSIHYSCDIRRSAANRIRIGDFVYIAPETWLNIPEPAIGAPPAIILENGCKIGRRNTISARNLIRVEEDVLFAPAVLLMDHTHKYSNVNLPIHAQGVTEGGTIVIERNCWIGYGAAILSGRGEVRIGRNSVIGAHSVVLESLPPYSIAVGSPARIVKQYDPTTSEWQRVEKHQS
jgi:UDP-3-O-[3-hydroxymyristoyl] glucosamine N-acyltransferase